MSWTTVPDYTNTHLNQNQQNLYSNLNFNTGSTTPLSTGSSASNFNQKHLFQELSSKLINTSGNLGTNSQLNLNYSAPSTVSSVSSESISDFKGGSNNSSNMGTQIDNYFANEDNNNVSSQFWSFNKSSNDPSQSINTHNQKGLQNYQDDQIQLKLGKNTIEEENFFQNQLSQSAHHLQHDPWNNNNYQFQNNSHLNTSNTSLNHSNSDQSLFELMKLPGLTNSSNSNTIPSSNNTQFSNNNSQNNTTTTQTATTTTTNNSQTTNGLSYTASTTPLPSTPLSSKSPEQMGFTNLSQFQQQAQFTPQSQQGVQSQVPQLQQQSQYVQQPQPQGMTADALNNNTQSLLQNYQQQQTYLEQLQQQHQQLLQNPLFIQQQAQLVSQQLQQLQLQLQIQKQQIESNNYQLINLQNNNPKDQSSSNPSSIPLTEENLIKLQTTPKDETPIISQQKANSTSSQDPDKQASINTELYKTELCSTFNKTGSCPYGNKCQFAHGDNELKVVNRGSKYRSKPCANWAKTGSCRYGNRCCFKHGN